MAKRDPYKTLGVDKTATPEQIKTARRRKAAQAHPDAGGEHDAMAEINAAYDVLINPERRRLYDTTSEAEPQRPLESAANDAILQAFNQALQADAPDILAHAINTIQTNLNDAKSHQSKLEREREKLERRSGKIKVKSGDNLFQGLIDQHLQGMARGIEHFRNSQTVNAKALEILANYSSEEAAPPRRTATYDEISELFRLSDMFRAGGFR